MVTMFITVLIQILRKGDCYAVQKDGLYPLNGRRKHCIVAEREQIVVRLVALKQIGTTAIGLWNLLSNSLFICKIKTPEVIRGFLVNNKVIWRLPFWREKYRLFCLRNTSILFLF